MPDTPQQPSRAKMLAPLLLLFALLMISSIVPIESYDYFWHLATGKWIAQHHALPRIDPFAVASERGEWINGEWLFELPLYLKHQFVGDDGMSILRAILSAALFTGLAYYLTRRGVDPFLSIAVPVLCWWGGDFRLGVRPEAIATLFVMAAVIITVKLHVTWRLAAAYAALAVIWINVHPSALLAPVIALLGGFGAVVGADDRLREARMRLALVAASALALLVNPYGWKAVVAPMRLASTVSSGAFVNMEWSPSYPLTFPLFYLTIIGAAVLVVRSGALRHEIGRVLLLALFAILAVRFVRNQGYWFSALPILIAPFVPRAIPRALRFASAGLSLVVVLLVLARNLPFTTGVDPELFPVHSVAQLKASGLRGNIYNPDQFGGFLIWNFYPERRVLTDGRNELHATLLREYAKARLDDRAWQALCEKYRLTLAVDEFHRERLTVRDPKTGMPKAMPPSLLYFPRSRWALVGFDDVSMVFARRDSHPAAVIDRMEYHAIVPDAPDPIADRSSAGQRAAAMEIARAKGTLGNARIVSYLESRLASSGR